MPPPEWLIEGIVPKGAFVTIYAPPESYKSFVTIDLALSVASGIAWQGHATMPGFVIYIAGEGVGGLSKRLLAWHMRHEIDPSVPDIAWLTESLSITAESEALIALLERIEQEVQRVPTTIVIDTLARCFDGEESETGDMGRFVAGVEVLRRKFGCAVVIVHHTRLDGTRERGNTALRGASDTMLAIERDGKELIVSCAKQKDAEHFEDIVLEFDPVEGTGSGTIKRSTTGAKKERLAEELLDLLRQTGSMTWVEWKERSGFDERVFASVTAGRAVRERIEKVGGRWQVRA